MFSDDWQLRWHEIAAAYDEGYSLSEIAKAYGVSRHALRRFLRRAAAASSAISTGGRRCAAEDCDELLPAEATARRLYCKVRCRVAAARLRKRAHGSPR